MRYWLRLALLTLAVTLTPTWAAEATETEQQWMEVRMALIGQETDKVKALLAKNPQLLRADIDGMTLMTLAAVEGSPDILQYLHEQGADINAKDDYGYTAIMRALEYGQVENALKLKDLGATLDWVSDDGNSAAVLAEDAGLADFAPPPAAAEPKLSREELTQILLLAAEVGDIDSLKFALEQGASATATAKNGLRASMLAALGGHAEAFKLLGDKNGLWVSSEYYPGTTDLRPYEVDGIDEIQSILVGEGGGDHQNAIEMLAYVKKRYPERLSNTRHDYYTIAENIGYDQAVIDRFFELSYEPLPRLENPFPRGKATPEKWKKVQRILKDKGLYSGKIDGKPGAQTYAGLYGYFRPMIEMIRENAIIAAQRAKKPVNEIKKIGQNQPVYAYEYLTNHWKNEKHTFTYKISGEYLVFTQYSSGNYRFNGFLVSKKQHSKNIRYLYFKRKGDFKTLHHHSFGYVFDSYDTGTTKFRAKILDFSFYIVLHNDHTEYYYYENGKKKLYKLSEKNKLPSYPDL